jgi:hypothetical protein
MHPKEKEELNSATPLSDSLQQQMSCGLANAGFAGLTPEMIQGAAAYYGVGADPTTSFDTRDLTIWHENGGFTMSVVNGYDKEDLVRNAIRRGTMKGEGVEKVIIHSVRESYNIMGY